MSFRRTTQSKLVAGNIALESFGQSSNHYRQSSQIVIKPEPDGQPLHELMNRIPYDPNRMTASSQEGPNDMYLSRISDRSRIYSRESLNKLEGNDGKVVTEYNNIPIRQVNFSKLKTEFIIKSLGATEKHGTGGSHQTTSRVTVPTKQRLTKKH